VSIQELAREVVIMLDAQAKYFKTREQADLIASKRLEKSLREKARRIMDGVEPDEPRLF
jgi:hypothetical protein